MLSDGLFVLWKSNGLLCPEPVNRCGRTRMRKSGEILSNVRLKCGVCVAVKQIYIQNDRDNPLELWSIVHHHDTLASTPLTSIFSGRPL